LEEKGGAMAAKVIHVGLRDLGRNVLLSDGFVLGTLPGGGYGVRWRRSCTGVVDTEYWSPWDPGGLGTTVYWFPWGPPQEAVRIEFEGKEYVFCQETASDADVARAERVQYEHLQEGR
jgi:hypothetical protein